MRGTLTALAFAMSLVLQAILAPLVGSAMAPKSAQAGVTAAVAHVICESGASDPSGKTSQAQHDCCVLCGWHSRDAVALVAFAIAVLTLEPSREAEAVAHVVPHDALPPSNGFSSSWSSRAPPFFS